MTSRNPKTARGPIRRILLAAILGLVLTAALAGGWAGYLQLVGNIHTVERGELYRSAQLDGPALEAVIRKDGIATVLNLRSANPGTPWYDRELAATAAAGAAHLDLALSANKIKTDALSNFNGSTEERRVNGSLNGGGLPVTVSAGSGTIRLTIN